ncbi:ABC transporter permease [Phytoactinopolyspora limicola]|uniref:ABC transporter permease n=1 Tax=Phytoactinopolyspora limicola TaxID=2715536 RepID=UPI00140B1C4F|nr:ABC transporter permease [Phytoactinopolyspora limicola]
MTSSSMVDVTTKGPSMRRNFWRGVWRVMKRKPSRLFGALLMALFVFMATIGPMLYSRPLPRDPNNFFASPSLRHPFGTDFQGTDVLSLVVIGSRYVLLTALITAVVTIVLGASIGLFAGYRRGRMDAVLMRITDINLTIPGIPILLVLSTVWQFASPWEMGLVLGLLGWGALARAVRSQTLSLRERGFIEAARGLGLSTPHIVFRELLPPIAPYIAMNLLMSMILAVWAQVGLFFLGVMPVIGENWGVMLNRAVFDFGAMTTAARLPYMLAPLLALMLLTVAIVLVVDAMDEIFNPRLREE